MATNGFRMQVQDASGRLVWKIAKPRMYAVTISHDAVAGSINSGVIQIDPMQSFILTDQSVYDTNDPGLTGNGVLDQYENAIQVQDQSQNYLWSNQPIPRSSFARDRAHGYRLPNAISIDANTRLTVSIQNPPAGATQTPAAGSTTITFTGYSICD